MSRRNSRVDRTLRSDLEQAREAAVDASRKVDQVLRETVSGQPVLAVGAAAGLGFLLGGGMRSSAVTVLLGVGARMAGAYLEREFNPQSANESSHEE